MIFWSSSSMKHFKVLLLGASGAGKTELVNQLTEQSFNEHCAPSTSLEETKMAQTFDFNGTQVKLILVRMTPKPPPGSDACFVDYRTW